LSSDLPRVLTSVLADVPAQLPSPNRAALQAGLDAAYMAAVGPIPASPFKRMGIQAGNAAADAMIAARQGDGRFGPSPWNQQAGAGYWQPLFNPVTGLPQLDPTPWAGGVQPFMLTSPSQFRTPGPNPLGSPQWVADYNEVKALGSVNSAVRTAEQTHNALFWQSNGGPPLLWGDVADDLAEGSSMSIADTARLLAMLN